MSDIYMCVDEGLGALTVEQYVFIASSKSPMVSLELASCAVYLKSSVSIIVVTRS